MRNVLALGSILALLLFCPSSLWAEVYTIDFNRGNAGGNANGFSGLPDNNAESFCKAGWENIAEYSQSFCYYKSTGSGIRIGKTSGSGLADILITFSEEIQGKNITKIVVYASKGTDDMDAVLSIYAGTNEVTKTIGFADMNRYDSSYPESSNYILPDIILGRMFKMLKIAARNPNFVMLHRIDIYTSDDSDDDAIMLPASDVDDKDVPYNLSGQRVGKPFRGIYIRGGRKFVVK